MASDSLLEEAAGAWADKGFAQSGDTRCLSGSFLAGAAYMLERMRCGTCKYLMTETTSAGPYCKRDGCFVTRKYGCRLWEGKE